MGVGGVLLRLIPPTYNIIYIYIYIYIIWKGGGGISFIGGGEEGEKPLIEVPSPEYTAFIDKLKGKKHIRKSVFVTKDGKFLCEYEGIMAASKDLKIGHDTIKKNIENKTTYKRYRFSYHREQD